MARGRRPLAPEVHRAKGTFLVHPERENKAAPTADGGRPEPPKFLKAAGRRKWDEMCDHLGDNRVLSKDNREILIAYCTAYEGWMKSRAEVAKTGLTIMDDKGNIRRNPAMIELHKFRDTMNRLLPEFGLTPASRGKLVARAGEDETDPVLEMLKRMKATRERGVG